jgi:hypothetical protein
MRIGGVISAEMSAAEECVYLHVLLRGMVGIRYLHLALTLQRHASVCAVLCVECRDRQDPETCSVEFVIVLVRHCHFEVCARKAVRIMSRLFASI